MNLPRPDARAKAFSTLRLRLSAAKDARKKRRGPLDDIGARLQITQKICNCSLEGRDASPRRPGGDPLRRWKRLGQRGAPPCLNSYKDFYILVMPIYEFVCPQCRKIYNFLSKTVHSTRLPVCPKCGSAKMVKQVSAFSMPRGAKEPANPGGAEEAGPPMPDTDDPRMMKAMAEMERDMEHMDENNPRHMAHLMRKMKDLMPADSVPKDLDIAIRRLEAGEDPEKIEQDMGDVLGDLMGGEEEAMGGGGGGGYSHDAGWYAM